MTVGETQNSFSQTNPIFRDAILDLRETMLHEAMLGYLILYVVDHNRFIELIVASFVF